MTDVVSRYVELMCHEINNPLTIVYGQAALLKKQLEREPIDAAVGRERLGRVDDNTVRIVGLVRELREALREVENEPQQVLGLADLLGQARVFNERWCRVKGGVLVFDPSTVGPLVCVRPVLARGILWRLMGRALQLSQRVDVRAQLEGEHLRVTLGVPGNAEALQNDRALTGMIQTLRDDRVELRPWAGVGDGAETGLELRFPRVD